MPATTTPHPTADRTAVTPVEDSSARATRRIAASPGSTPAPGRIAFAVLITFVVAAIAFGGAAAHPAAGVQPSFELGLDTGFVAQGPGCVPVPGAECGSVRVPLFRSRPAGPKIGVGYVLVRHRDRALPVARGTAVLNVGGSNAPIIDSAPMWTEFFADLLRDHDLLLIDSRGGGRSHPIRCGVTALPATRKGFVRGIARCGRRLGRRARAYTDAATADDMEAVRKRLGIPKLDLYGVSTGTYLMTVFAQRHPESVRSIVLSSAFPLRFDMWGRANARALRLAIRRVCTRSTTGKCDGARTLRQLGRLARRLHAHPLPYRLNGQRRRLDDTTLAGLAYQVGSGGFIGQLPAVVRAALRRDNRPLISAARTLGPLFRGSQVGESAPDQALAASLMCNDYPTLWDRRARIPGRQRQFAARRAWLAEAAFRPFGVRAWTSAIVDRGNGCIRWPDRNGPVQRTSGPFPDVPVLVISGDLDPNVPTAEGRQATRQFPHARLIEIPNAWHGPELEPTGCAVSITTNFIRNQRLGDTSCLSKIPPLPVS